MSITVDVTGGRLAGLVEDDIAVFRGIRYAAPPVGALRWRPPEPPAPWSGVRDAIAFGPVAPQLPARLQDVYGGVAGQAQAEDCLTLNVWTPGTETARRPVLVWIHGGGFDSGAGSMAGYSGDHLAEVGDIVVVTINYRLGALGFMYAPELDPDGSGHANFGILDQMAALDWVQKNIASFGGDPRRVTIAGQSAGAASVAALLAIPKAHALFHRAILQSLPLGVPAHDVATAERHAALLRDALGVRTAADLRAVPAEALLRATAAVTGKIARFADPDVAFQLVVDGATLEQSLQRTLLDGGGARVDILCGSTREEMGAFFGLVPALQSIDEATVRKRLRGRLGAEADDAYAAYLRSRPRRRPIDVLTDAVTDEVFRMPTLRLAEAHARVGRAAYVYQLDWPAPGYGGALGACHTLDLPLVFGDPQRWQPTAHMLDGAEPTILAGLAEAMSQSWAAFVRDGNPGHDGAPAWPPYDASRRMTMRFHVLTEVVSDAARTWRPFW